MKSTTAPIRALQVSSADVYGGNEEHVRTLATFLRHEGCVAAALTPEGAPLAEKLRARGLATFAFRSKKLSIPRMARDIAWAAKQFDAQIVHTHNRREDFAAFLVDAFTPRKIVVTLHDRVNMREDGSRARGVKAWLYGYGLRRRTARVIAVSRATREDAIAVCDLPKEHIVHVVNGCDFSRVAPTRHRELVRKEIGLAERDVAFGLIARVRGRAFTKKGCGTFLEAASLVDLDEARFVFVGEDAAAREALAELAREKGVADRVIFLGYRTDMGDVLNALDVVVLPSLFEGLPRSLMEAMGLGRAVIGTAVDGIQELVEDEKTGLLVPVGDAQALAACMARLASSTDERNRLGGAAREFVRKEYAPEKMARETASVYREVVGETQSR